MIIRGLAKAGSRGEGTLPGIANGGPMLRKWLLLLFSLTLAQPLWAQDDFELSYLLVRRSDGQVLAAQEPDKPRTPASTMKVITAAAALEQLGLEHRYRTVLRSLGEIQRGHLRADLGLLGDADPELTTAHFDELADALHAQGIRWIDGDLLIDEGPFAQPPYGNGWAWDDCGEDYQPEITGLAVNGGIVSTFPGFQAPWLTIQSGPESTVRMIPGREGVVVSGELPDHLAPPNSSLRSGETLLQALARKGIKLRGKLKYGLAEGRELAVHESRPLAEILRQALKVSDNLAMELIYRSSGEALPRALEGQRLRRADGCGLSRYNLISARQLTLVLLSEPGLSELLPTGGEGTLATRFLTGRAAGKVRAKTGTLGNVSALAGYLAPGTPQECVFAILINGHLDPTAERKAIEGALVETWASSILNL